MAKLLLLCVLIVLALVLGANLISAPNTSDVL